MPDVERDVPATFGKYYLTEKLATGGMAEIYLAKIIGPNGFEKPLVIKQIHPDLSGQRQFVDLFVAEAKTLVTLAHGNIVPVYELGVVDDTYFIAMDYIDGPTLHRLTEIMIRRRDPMSPGVAAWIAARILDGLDYAHRKGGVIHRDLSPRNVMLSRDGEVKLVDFGIAVALSDAQPGVASHAAPTGSFPYMSPEQARREPLSPQTDLFSMGVLLWEMLVGRRLFARNSADETLNAVLEAPIPAPSHERAGIAARLDEVVMRALERNRAARWASASDMLTSINKYLYSLDNIPGPRDIAAWVAKHCPPTTRRLPTDIEAMGPEGEVSFDRSGPVQLTSAMAPHTAVLPRNDAAPKGKQAHRHQTFATHVALTDLLRRAGTQDDSAITGPSPGNETHARSQATPAPGRTPRRESPGWTPGNALLISGSLIGFALLAAAVYVFYQRKDDVLAQSAAAIDSGKSTASMGRSGETQASTTGSLDAPPNPPVPANGSNASIAAPPERPNRDEPARRPMATAASIRTGRAAPSKSAGPVATLVVGANPWGEVFVDGVKLSRHAPSDFAIAPGRHEIRVVFPAESPPLVKICAVEVAAGETKRCDADFTK